MTCLFHRGDTGLHVEGGESPQVDHLGAGTVLGEAFHGGQRFGHRAAVGDYRAVRTGM